ncbi:MAG: DUF1684 domain-containing protein [Ignavibacteriaceae bacterium]
MKNSILKTLIFLIPFIPLLTAVSGCKSELSYEEKADPGYKEEIMEWVNKRESNLVKENGWLNLTGLFWLEEGENTFGGGKSNDIVFPGENLPERIGVFTLNDSLITVKIEPGVNVTLNDSANSPVTETTLKDDLSGNPTVLALGSLRWFVIKRGDKYGIRLRDLNAKTVREFKGIERFPVDSNWRKEATFIKYDPPKKIKIPSIIGIVEEELSPGAVEFEHNNKKFRIDAIDAGSRLFLIFADETSGEETYGAGRFLYVDKPDSSEKIILDFNKAYNPPCVFTKYATCPLPPEQNYLKLRITAGEKTYVGGH